MPELYKVQLPAKLTDRRTSLGRHKGWHAVSRRRVQKRSFERGENRREQHHDSDTSPKRNLDVVLGIGLHDLGDLARDRLSREQANSVLSGGRDSPGSAPGR